MSVAQTRKSSIRFATASPRNDANQFNLHNTSDPSQTTAYACREPGCLVRYDSSRGYFLVQGGNESKKKLRLASLARMMGHLCISLKCSRRTLVIACGDARNARRAEPMRKASQSANPSEHFMLLEEKPWRPGAAGIATAGISRWILIGG